MKNKKRIGFFISDKAYVRNFIDTGILNNLSKSFDIYVFFKKDLNFEKNKIIDAKLIESYELSKNDKYHQYANLVSLWNRKEKAISFEKRVIEYYNIDIIKIKNFFSFIKSRLSFYLLIFFSSQFVFPIFKKIFINRIKRNTDLINKIKKYEIDLVIQPTSGHLSDTLDLLSYCNEKNILSYLIIDNWDNLSSKVCYYYKPDFISTWGEQSKLHAIKFQDLKREQITVVGSARFDNYFKIRDENITKIFEKKYVLFLGSSLPWDENFALKILDDHLQKNKDYYKDLFIVYRPHPFRKIQTNFKNENFKNVILDPQIENLEYRKWPNLEYYPKIISNSLFVVGGLTSMMIESLIFWKKYIAISYFDDFYRNPEYILKTRPHLFEINNVDNLYLCKDKSQLKNIFFDVFNKHTLEEKNKVDEQRNFFLYNDHLNFEDRIKDQILKIIDKIQTHPKA